MRLPVLHMLILLFVVPLMVNAQKRLVIIDQDGSGPGDSNQMSIMALLQSQETDVLGITIVTGNAWRDEEVQHTLRMLELTGHANVQVVPGAVFPLVRNEEETQLEMKLYGKAEWLGAWGGRVDSLPPTSAGVSEKKTEKVYGPWEIPPLQEGSPKIKALDEDAVHFLVREVHAHPGQVTIFALGPLTDIALAVSIDPKFAELTKGLVIMGGSLNPQTDDPEFATNPRHEFNFWFDPEAAHIVLRAPWPRVDVTTVDVSIKTFFTKEMYDEISKSSTLSAQYIKNYSPNRYYMWDELAACAWLDPSIITKSRELYMDVDISHSPGYGNTLTWDKTDKPVTEKHMVHAQVDVNLAKFNKMFVDLMTSH